MGFKEDLEKHMRDKRHLWDPKSSRPDAEQGAYDVDVDKHCTAQVVESWRENGWSGDQAATQAMIEWLVEDVPQSWIDNLSSAQKKSRNSRDWSFVSRDMYDYPVSRLEYWSVTHTFSTKKPGESYYSYMNLNFLGIESGDGGWWSSSMLAFNRAEWTAAKNIIWWLWGELNGDEFGDDGSLKLSTKSSPWTDAELKFAQMIGINQGHSQIIDRADWFGGWDAPDDTYPWAGPNNWIQAGEVDPVIYNMVHRLVKHNGSVNHPYNPDNMGYKERVTMSKGNYLLDGGDGDPEVEAGLAMFREDFTVANFHSGVHKLLMDLTDSPDTKEAIWWDGEIPGSSDEAMGLYSVNLTQILHYNRTDHAAAIKGQGRPYGLTPGDRSDPPYEDSTKLDWDCGLAYDESRKVAKFRDYSDASDIASNRKYSTSGIARMIAYINPQGSSDWLNGTHGGQTWIEYKEVIKAIWTAGRDGYLKSADKKGTPAKKGGSNIGNRPLEVRDSGYIDWKSLVVSPKAVEKYENYRFGPGDGNDFVNDQRINKEAKTYIPQKVAIKSGGTVVNSIDLSKTIVDLAADIKANPPGSGGNAPPASFTGDASNITSDNEAANKIKDSILESFYKFAGNFDVGWGGQDPEGLRKWMKNNLKGSVFPNTEAKSFTQTINLETSKPEDIGLPAGEDGQAALVALKNALEGDEITFVKSGTPWYGLTKKGIGLIDFNNLLRRYVASAYVTTYYYRKLKKGMTHWEKTGKHPITGEQITEAKLPNMEEGKIWNHYMALCAHHMFKIWGKVVHDNECGNFYSLIVLLLSQGSFKDANAEALANALAALAGGSADDMVKDLGTEAPPDGSLDVPPDDTSKEQRERFYKQCALLLNMHRLKYNDDKMTGPYHEQSVKAGFTTYNGRLHQISNEDSSDGKKNAILNKLISPKPSQMSPFLDIETSQVASLQPYIRLYQVWTDPVKGLQEIEFDFPLYPERDISARGFDRGDGVGVKEFTWEYDGETPATASKYIKANLSLYFQTFDDFVKARKNKSSPRQSFRWVDLFVSPTAMIAREEPKYNTPHHLRYDPEYYRIRVDVGYNLAGHSSGMREALRKQNSTFFLVLIDNDIEINEDMSVNVTANYRAYIEEAMDSNKFNALTSPEIERAKREQKLQWEGALAAYKKGTCTDVQLRQVRNIVNEQMEALIKKQHKAMMTNMLNHGRIFYVDFDESAIKQFRQTGHFSEIPAYDDQAFSVGPESSAADFFKAQMKKKDKQPWATHPQPYKGMRVYYFYLGDLFYLLASNLYDKDAAPHISEGLFKDNYKKGAENTKFLLMDFDYHNSLVSTASSRRTINIADVPIAVDFFFEWYINNVIKNEVTTMGIGQFIRRMLTEMVTEAMAEVCMTGEEGHYVTFQLGSMSAGGQVLKKEPSSGKAVFTDPVTKMLFKDYMAQSNPTPTADTRAAGNPYILDVSAHYGKDLPLPRTPNERQLKKLIPNGVQGIYNYVFIYGDFADPFHSGRGDEDLDNNVGTYHLHLGRDKGLVKKISFSKNNIPYHRESRMFNQGQAGQLQLSAVYDCEISMIGNTLFLPGMELFVNPYGFGGPAFGKPQDPPLKFSPTVAEIDSVNQSVDTASLDGKIDSAEASKIATGVDDLQAQVTARQKSKKNLAINSYANVMGVGGYQLIIRIKCSIKPGSFETIVNAKHTYTGYPAIKQANRFADFRGSGPGSVSSSDTGGTTGCSQIIRKVGDTIT